MLKLDDFKRQIMFIGRKDYSKRAIYDSNKETLDIYLKTKQNCFEGKW